MNSGINIVLAEHDGFIRMMAYKVGLRLPLVHKDDVLQAAYIGFIDAYKKYDNSRGASFKTYLSLRITGSILDEGRSQNPFSRRNQEKEHPLTQHQFGDGEEESLIAPPEQEEESLPELEEIIRPLYSYEHRKILRESYGEGKSLLNIGKELGITESRVCQLRIEALGILRMMYKAQGKEFELPTAE